ncbi:MAG: tetratricopeptide repeat protein [Pseudomonadota bacterium]
MKKVTLSLLTSLSLMAGGSTALAQESGTPPPAATPETIPQAPPEGWTEPGLGRESDPTPPPLATPQAPEAGDTASPAPEAEAEPTETAAEKPRARPRSREEKIAEALEGLKADDATKRGKAEQALRKAWSSHSSPSFELLLQRGRDAAEAEEPEKALKLLTDLVNLAPDFAEAWNARATVHYSEGNLGAALADIADTLAKEPRHYGALTGMGVIFEQLGDEKRAVSAFRSALEIHPHLEVAKEGVKRLAKKVDGVDI